MTAEPAPSVAAGDVCGLGDLEGRTFVEILAERVARAPQGRFWSLRQPGHPRSRTYGELWARSGRLAAGLAGRAPSLGSPIVLMLDDGLDFIPAFWACLRAGLVPVPLARTSVEGAPGGRSPPLGIALASLAPRLVVADGTPLSASLRDALPCAWMTPAELDGHAVLADDLPPADLACLLATSGSTGTAKLIAVSVGAMLHRSFTTSHPAVADHGATITTFPLDSTSGIACVILGTRESVHLPMATIAREPTALLDAVETFRASSFSITDTMAGRVADAATSGARRWDLSSLRRVGLGAEAVLPSTVRRLDSVLRGFGAPAGTIRASYGTTETGTLLTGFDPLADEAVGGLGVPLGRPAPNVALRIVDEAGATVPEGTVGDVEVRAPLKVFAGYWGDPDATARGFTADGWWRTGDTGLLWGGHLALKGRAKEVFIFNGRKHALRAIDEALHRALGPGETAYACTLPGRDGGPETLGIVLLASAARQAAAEAEARAAVATAFGLSVGAIRLVPASALPLTPTGKVRRLDLAALLAGPDAVVDDAPAAAEPSVLDDFGEWLRHRVAREAGTAAAGIDVRAPIAALGLDSLAVLGLKGEIARRFGRDAPPALAWHEASIAEIVAAVLGRPMAVGGHGPPVPVVPGAAAAARREGLHPLSYGQEYTWRSARRPDARPHYRVLVRFSIEGPLRPDLFQATLDEVVRRHEHLRTTFAEVDGVAGQRIHAPSPAEVVFTDLSSHRRPTKGLAEVRRAAAERDLDLASGPLFVAYLTRVRADDHRLYLLLHHVLFDARSLVILLGEVDRIYRSLAEGRPLVLEPPLQMADFARDERRRLDPSSPHFADEVRWWRDYWHRCAPSRTRFRFERARFAGSVRVSDCNLVREIPKDLHDRVKAISLDRGTTLFVAYCAAAAVTLVRHSSESDVVLGTYLSNRSAPAKGTIGYFLNLVQFHLVADGAATWAEVMQRTHDAVVAVAAHRDIPHHLLVDALREGGTREPPLRAVFQYLPADHAWTIPGLTFEGERDAGSRVVHGHISFSVTERRHDVSAMLRLNGHRHHTAALAPLMDMFFDHLASLARGGPVPTAKALPPSLPSRLHQALRSGTFGGRAGTIRGTAGPDAEADDLRREVDLLRGVAQERADLIARLHGEAERQRAETTMLRSVAEERARLTEALHTEAERQRAETTMLRFVAEERARLTEALHTEAERQRTEIAALHLALKGEPHSGEDRQSTHGTERM